MVNKFDIDGEKITMMVQDQCIIFSFDDLPKLQRFNQWKLSRSKSVVADYRKGKEMMRITMHFLLTGSKFVKWLNGNKYDFRKENIMPIKKSIRPRPCGANLKGNEYRIEGGDLVILIKTKGEKIHEAYADLEDYDLVSKYTWNKNPVSGYIQAKERLGRSVNKHVYMHRLIMGVDDSSIVIDHINGVKQDNRKQNLRRSNNSSNMHNTYKHRKGEVGVSKTYDGYWVAQMQIDGCPHRKTFKNFDDAVEQYRKWQQEFNPSGLNGENK